MEAIVVGDAVGLQVELRMQPPSREWLEDTSSIPEPVGDLNFYPYGDEAELALILAETIISSCGFNPTMYARMMAEKADTGNPLRYYDPGVVEVIEAVRRGGSWFQAARMVNYGAGNPSGNAAVRGAPIAIYYRNIRLVEAMAEAQALVTHANLEAVEAARVYALALHYTLKDVKPSKLPGLLAEATGSSLLALKLKRIPMLTQANPPRAVKELGNSERAFDTIAAAVYAYVRAEGDPLQALLNAVSMAGNSGAITAAALALAAAYKGTIGEVIGSLPARVEKREYAASMGAKLTMTGAYCKDIL
jgi:poly(ADP-ribose) glycohydrolase ARH3